MKYSLSEIMQDAWKSIRNGMGRSEAMKQSWKAAKDGLSYWKWKPFLGHKRDVLAKQYHVEPHDIENELWIWFNTVIQRYDAKKSCVFTYLQNQFLGFETDMKRKNEKTINETSYIYYLQNQFRGFKTNVKQKEEKLDETSYIYEIADPQREKFEDIISFYLEIDKKLSENAKQVLQFVFESELSPRIEKDPTKKVSINATIRYFHKLHGWTVSAVKRAWEEIRVWWREFEYI